MIQHMLDFRIPARQSIPHHNKIRHRLQVFGIVTLEYRNLLLGEEIAHRGINPLVRTGDLITAFLQHGCKRSHAGPAYADQMNSVNRVNLHGS